MEPGRPASRAKGKGTGQAAGEEGGGKAPKAG